MTQTEKGQKGSLPPQKQSRPEQPRNFFTKVGVQGSLPPQKQSRPGQRQQDRLMRQARRRRQRLLIGGSLLGVILIALAGVGIWQYPRIITLFQHHTPTIRRNYACSVAHSSPNLYASTPAAGPAAPPDVRTAPGMFADGLQCIDLKIGNGPAAQIGSVVSFEYTGWLADTNRKFDSSYDRHAEPFQVLLGGKAAIVGLEEGLTGLKAGSIRRLIIPPALGYGDQGQPPNIPANATLIFDIIVQSMNNCPVAAGTNIYNSTSAATSTSIVGPVLPSGPSAPPPVTTTASTMLNGLQCIDLKVGTGAPVVTGNTVSIQYTGWFVNGKKFDSSYDDGGTPLSLPVGRGKGIRGIDEGLIGMKVGGTRRLIIPPALAYGAQGRPGAQGQPPVIPPNATLIFDITLVSIQ